MSGKSSVRAAYAADGTPRCKDPQQDAAGNWFCPACGRAEGFKSKMSVLGHLRSCRPGRPAIAELLETPASVRAAPKTQKSEIYVPTPNESAQINGMGAILSRLDQMASVQAQHSKALGNHITHLSAATAAPAAGASLSMTEVVKWGAVAVGALAVVQQLGGAPRTVVVPAPPLSDGARRIKAMADGDKARRCAAQWQAKAAGEEVVIDPDCLSPEERERKATARRQSAGGMLKSLASAAKDAASVTSVIKKLF